MSPSRRSLALTVLTGALAACTSSSSGSAGPLHVQLSGAVQKGPFVLGSPVSVSPLDASGHPTGEVFATKTVDDLGNFQLDFDATGLVSLEGTGNYYNEVTGLLSTSPLTLRAVHTLTAGGAQHGYLNLVTHLTYDRVLRLIEDGIAPQAAITQAEAELRGALGLGGAAFDPKTPGIAMNILGGGGSGGIANAYLFALSACVAEAARIKAGLGGSVDANVQELLNRISLDLSDDGKLGDAQAKPVRDAQRTVDPDETTTLLRARLAELGSAAEVPDLNLVLDSDGDGVVNANDTCPLIANPAQAVIPNGYCSLHRVTTVGPTFGEPVQTLALADLTGDGVPDLVSKRKGFEGKFNAQVSPFWVAPGDGKGGFGAFLRSDARVAETFVFLGLRDTDGDGHLDLVSTTGSYDDLAHSTSGFGSNAVVFPSDGAGRFGAGRATEVTLADVSGTALAMGQRRFVWADVDGDGVPDYVGAEALLGTGSDGGQRGALVVALGNADGSFGALHEVAGHPPTVLDDDVAAGDLNGDGRTDLVVATESGGAGSDGGLYVLLGKAGGGFTEAGPLPGVAEARRVVVGDFDGDGQLDVAAFLGVDDRFNPPGDAVFAIFRGDGKGGLAEIGRTSLGPAIDFLLPDRLTVARRSKARIVVPVASALHVLALDGGRPADVQQIRVTGTVDAVLAAPIAKGGPSELVVQLTKRLADGTDQHAWSVLVSQ